MTGSSRVKSLKQPAWLSALGTDKLNTSSRLFLIFWIFLAVGIVLGNKIDLPYYLVLWFGLIWLVVFISGQESTISVLALALSATAIGYLIWQATGGEAWLPSSWLGPLSDHLLSVRDRLVDQMFLALPEPHGTLLGGILFGSQLPLGPELVRQFRAVGLSHIIAVSGYNLTILTANILALGKPLLGRKSYLLALLAIVGFVLLSGAPASILRAAVMASLVLVSQVIGRPSRSLNLLVVGAGILILFEPKIIYQIGFLLSVAATYGLLQLSPLVERKLRFIPFQPIRQVLAETLSATAMTAPLIIVFFEQFSVVSPLANILILPLIPLLMGLGIFGSVIALISPTVGGILLLAAWPILEWIVRVTHWLSGLSFAVLHPAFSGYVAAAIIALIIIAAEIWRLRLQTIDVEE